ncbi:Protein of unknown function DUF4128 [uncultured Caudovirales phage]|uniref:Tail completion protein n=1 Tax=uncultured Caudovirales phage TaxID=2100421 RepID=A0A6J7XGK0_9CAUD|nr:Protein of unknown function DUF4128 [uncultured Caudovirales phage]CAB5226955.1 Protein of unknown function DUF4128 [uncultured Caudovirales phage]
MSVLNIKVAIETALNNLTPKLDTVWENTTYAPILGRPYQQLWFLDFITKHVEINATSYQVDSYFQIDLMYPMMSGSGTILARAELIKSLFKQGSSFINGGQTVNITETPSISSGRVDGDRWKIIVKVYYSSWIIVN